MGGTLAAALVAHDTGQQNIGHPDPTLRHRADAAKRRLGKPATAENKPGASGMIGLMQLIPNPADGCTLALFNSGPVTFDLLTPGFGPLTDFTPLSTLSNTPCNLLVNAASPCQTRAEPLAAERHSSESSAWSSKHGSGA